MSAELWRPIDGFAGFYEVSTRGRVRAVARVVTDALGRRRRLPGRLLKLADTRGRSPHCTLSRPGRRQTYYPRSAISHTYMKSEK
ncbi:NUMOD4 domain-containing protein [Mycolicibacterium sp. CBM1]